jgi:hypothetical protein
MTLSMVSMTPITIYGRFCSAYWQVREWTTLASMAVAKSRQNMWILVFRLFLTRESTHVSISF